MYTPVDTVVFNMTARNNILYTHDTMRNALDWSNSKHHIDAKKTDA